MQKRSVSGLILFGDSVFAGRGVKDKSLSCARLLKSKLPIPVSRIAKSYITSWDALNRAGLIAETDQNVYSHVVILIGNNEPRPVGVDCPAVSPEQFCSNLSTLINKVQEMGRVVLLCNLQPLQDEDILKILGTKSQLIVKLKPSLVHEAYSNICDGVAAKEDVHFVNIRKALQSVGERVISDYCLDPNELGHKIVASEIMNVLKSIDISLEKINI